MKRIKNHPFLESITSDGNIPQKKLQKNIKLFSSSTSKRWTIFWNCILRLKGDECKIYSKFQ